MPRLASHAAAPLASAHFDGSAIAAPARPGREIADAGRRDEARALPDRLHDKVAAR